MAVTKSKPYPPAFIRRVIDDVANNSVTASDISKRIDVSINTLKNWLVIGKVRRGREMTHEEVMDAVDKCINSATEGPKVWTGSKDGKGLVAEYRNLTPIQQEFTDYGYENMEIPKMELSERELTAFGGVLACLDRQISHLEKSSQSSESIQDVTTALIAGIGLKQLREVYLAPPPIQNWREVGSIVQMTREALDMNRKEKNDAPRIGIDLNILGMKPGSVKKSKPPIDVTLADEHLTD